MSRKLLIALAPVLAIAAFVVMPTAALAAPHWYSNGAIVGEAPVATTSWGLLLEVGRKAAGEGMVSCHVVTGGLVKNPGGGGAGEGATQEYSTYECSGNLPCSPGHEQAAPVPASLQGASGGWPSKLEEKEGIRVNTTGEEIELGCVEPPEFTKVEKGAIAVTSAKALQNPLGPSGARRGTSAAEPGTTEFDEKTGELELAKSMGVAKVATYGTLRMLGYEEQELINIKSP